MSKSLQDQLLALGIAKDKPKPSHRKKHKGRPRRKPAVKKTGKDGEISLDAAYRARNRDEKAGAEQAKAEKRALDLERRRINTAIDEMVKGKGLNDREGALKRNFLYKGKIRSVRVNAEQLKALNEGSLALVFLRGDYLVVPPALAAEVTKLSKDHVPDLSVDAPEEEEFPVPDDMNW